MASLQLEVRVSKSPELAAHGVLQAIRLAEAGDKAGAMRGYRAALATRFAHPDSWANLAALAIEHNAELVTFDRDFERFAGLRVTLL